jgi:hypothetical protein
MKKKHQQALQCLLNNTCYISILENEKEGCYGDNQQAFHEKKTSAGIECLLIVINIDYNQIKKQKRH